LEHKPSPGAPVYPFGGLDELFKKRTPINKIIKK